MNKSDFIVAIIPCYKANILELKELLSELILYVDHVIIIDDCCPNMIGDHLEKSIDSDKCTILWNQSNLGVGGATKRGFQFALNTFDRFIAVKVDCDRQMLPSEIKRLTEPIRLSNADFSKANRYFDLEQIEKIPRVRLIGNIILSFLTKASTGYWELFDPNNGFIAINHLALRLLPLKKISDDYFFESDLLFRAGLENLTVTEVRISPVYNGEVSSLEPFKQIPIFLKKHIINLIKRIFYQYFLFDFNPGSLELCISIVTFIFSMIWACYLFIIGYVLDAKAGSGDVGLFILSNLVGIQFFLAFLNYDSSQRVFLRKFNSQLIKYYRQ